VWLLARQKVAVLAAEGAQCVARSVRSKRGCVRQKGSRSGPEGPVVEVYVQSANVLSPAAIKRKPRRSHAGTCLYSTQQFLRMKGRRILRIARHIKYGT